MRYLVTGGAGFIGSHLVEHLVTAGHDVVVLDDFSTGKRERLAPWESMIRLIEGTLVNPDTCARAVEGVDYVLHQAAIPSVPRSVVAPLPTHEANATGTLNLLNAARTAGVRRVVYASSSSIYGDTTELPKHEGIAPHPLSPYSVAKLAGEHYMRAFHATYGLETIALRYFNIFGPRQDPASQYAAVVPRFIASALRDESPTIYGDGEQTRDFTFVENVLHANRLACDAPPSACGAAYNLGCGTRVTVNDLWRQIRRATGKGADPTYAPARLGDVRDSLASLDAIKKGLGYEPQVSLVEGLRRTVDWFRGSARP